MINQLVRSFGDDYHRLMIPLEAWAGTWLDYCLNLLAALFAEFDVARTFFLHVNATESRLGWRGGGLGGNGPRSGLRLGERDLVG